MAKPARDASWSAIIPLKPPGERKTRLAAKFSVTQRDHLGALMFAHVAAVLRAAPAIGDIILLCAIRPAEWPGAWVHDQRRGINMELQDAAKTRGTKNLLVIHADLPLLTLADIHDLTTAREKPWAIAPDRHGTGTNALAVQNENDFSFGFGDHSFDHHIAMAGGAFRTVNRLGLALDVDTPDDFDLALTLEASTLKMITL